MVPGRLSDHRALFRGCWVADRVAARVLEWVAFGNGFGDVGCTPACGDGQKKLLSFLGRGNKEMNPVCCELFPQCLPNNDYLLIALVTTGFRCEPDRGCADVGRCAGW